MVGGADGALEAGVGVVLGEGLGGVGSGGSGRYFRSMAEVVEEDFGGEMAGDFTSGCAPHAIADNEGAMFRECGAGVLIEVADAARMREHGEDTREVD